jgi:hypothetical protein
MKATLTKIKKTLNCKSIKGENRTFTLWSDISSEEKTIFFDAVIRNSNEEIVALGYYVSNNKAIKRDVEEIMRRVYKIPVIFSIKKEINEYEFVDGLKVKYDKKLSLQSFSVILKDLFPELKTSHDIQIEKLSDELTNIKETLKQEILILKSKLELEERKSEKSDKRLEIIYENAKIELEENLKISNLLISIENAISNLNLPKATEYHSTINTSSGDYKEHRRTDNESFNFYIGLCHSSWVIRLDPIDFYSKGPFDGPIYQVGKSEYYTLEKERLKLSNKEPNLVLFWKKIKEVINPIKN